MKKLLLVFPIVALVAAGCNSSPKITAQVPVPTPTATPTTAVDTAGWETYTSPAPNAFQISYPPDATISTPADDGNLSSGWLRIREGFGYIDINIPQAPPSPRENSPLNETITIAGKQYTGTGAKDAQTNTSEVSFPSGDKLGVNVTLGVEYGGNDPAHLVIPNQQDYTDAMNSMKAILATLVVK